MPQIDQLAATYASQIFWLLLFFGLTFFIVGRGMVPRVMETVASRDDQIAADLKAAQDSRNEADRQEAAWRTRENENRAAAQSLIAKAKADAAAGTEQRLRTAQESIDGRMAVAETRIADARTSAMAEIETVAADAVQDIVERLAGVRVDAPVAAQAVKEAMAHG